MRRFRIQNVSGAVLYVLLGVTAVVLALFFFGGETPLEERTVADLSKEEPLYTNLLLGWMYVLAGLVLLLTLCMMARRFAVAWVVSPREALRPWLGAGLLAVVLLVSWLLGSDVPLDIPGYDGTENTPFWLKLADMFLYAVYVLLGGGVALIAGFAVWKRWRR